MGRQPEHIVPCNRMDPCFRQRLHKLAGTASPTTAAKRHNGRLPRPGLRAQQLNMIVIEGSQECTDQPGIVVFDSLSADAVYVFDCGGPRRKREEVRRRKYVERPARDTRTYR